jgi:hypothetical protein
MHGKITCVHCTEEFMMREYSPGHVGLDVYRCDRCACSAAKNKASVPPGYHKGHVSIEEYMKPCECGGRFRKGADYLCPYCRSTIDVSSLRKPDIEITKRDSSQFYVEGFNRTISWRKCR